MASIKALIVDDEKEYVDILSERLTIRGIEVTGAVRGEDALVILETQPIDVVVLDVLMPGLSGIETLKKIKKKHPKVTVVMLSGHADVNTAVEGMDLGAFDYLVKPVSFEELFYKIEDAYNTDL